MHYEVRWIGKPQRPLHICRNPSRRRSISPYSLLARHCLEPSQVDRVYLPYFRSKDLNCVHFSIVDMRAQRRISVFGPKKLELIPSAALMLEKVENRGECSLERPRQWQRNAGRKLFYWP